MLIRNVLLLAFCVAVAVGISHLYSSHAYLVWGLLILCGVCFMLKRRAATMFKEQSLVRVPVSVRRRNSRNN
jgi:hypothetical protein